MISIFRTGISLATKVNTKVSCRSFHIFGMSCYMNLLRPSANTRQAFRIIRPFSFIHQSGRQNVLSRRNGTNLFSKRLKSNDSLQNKVGEEVKAQKVKLKVSDLRRLLSLAKAEKLKICGNRFSTFPKARGFEFLLYF